MQSYRILPSRPLSAYVKSIGFIKVGESSILSQEGARILPDAHFELTLKWKGANVVYFDCDHHCIAEGKGPLFFGLFSRGAYIQHPANLKLVEIKFWPWAMHTLTRFPLGEIHNTIVDASQVFGPEVQNLQNQITEALTFNEVVKLVEHFLLSMIYQIRQTSGMLRYGTVPFYQRQGMCSVEEAIKPLGLSRRTLERQFKKYYGISPKQFSRNLRVRRLAKLLSEQPGIRFTMLSYQCGYFDQSHMIREFKALTGSAPNSYFQSDPYLAPFYPDEQ